MRAELCAANEVSLSPVFLFWFASTQAMIYVFVTINFSVTNHIRSETKNSSLILYSLYLLVLQLLLIAILRVKKNNL